MLVEHYAYNSEGKLCVITTEVEQIQFRFSMEEDHDIKVIWGTEIKITDIISIRIRG